MSNHAYESAAQLRPRRGTPTALGELAAHAALRPASEADGGGAPDDLAVIGVMMSLPASCSPHCPASRVMGQSSLPRPSRPAPSR